jgi:hypothetical protein
MNDAARWSRTSHTIEPDPRWVPAVAERYERFLNLAAGPVDQ